MNIQPTSSNPKALWSMSVSGALSASFFQKDGTSREGIDWAVQLMRGNEKVPVIVRMYFVAGTTAETRSNTKYLSSVVLRRVNDLLNGGWDPKSFDLSQAQDMAIFVSNP